MSFRKIAALTGLALSTLPALMSGASAQMVSGNSIFKVERNGQPTVYIGEKAPNSDVPVTFLCGCRSNSARGCKLL
jgi:hypothetical protein